MVWILAACERQLIAKGKPVFRSFAWLLASIERNLRNRRVSQISFVLKLIIGGFTLTPLLAVAQTELHDYASSFTFENDLFFGTDKYYTDGVQLTIKGRKDQRSEGVKSALNNVCAFVGCASDDFQFSQTRIGQLMYTPVNIRNPLPQPFDRPWAGMLYSAADYHFLSKDDATLTTVTGEVGIIGPYSYADQTQSWIHKAVGAAKPLGWGNQIGGEVGVMAAVERRHAMGGINIDDVSADRVQLRTTGHWRVAVGNIMTYAGAGMTVIVGKNLPKVSPRESGGIVDKIVVDSASTSYVTRELDSSCVFQWLRCTAFASIEARAIAWNVFLDGPMFRGGPSIGKRPVVADVTLGFRLDLPRTRSSVTGPWFVQFKATRRSPEFRSTRPVQSQTFGALTVGTEF